MAEPLPEKSLHLWLIAASPAIWAVHFLVSYAHASVWCFKYAEPGGSLGPVRPAIVVYTVIAITGVTLIGWFGFRRHRHGESSLPHDWDSSEDRHRFLGYATLILSALSAVAILYAATVVAFIGSCR